MILAIFVISFTSITTILFLDHAILDASKLKKIECLFNEKDDQNHNIIEYAKSFSLKQLKYKEKNIGYFLAIGPFHYIILKEQSLAFCYQGLPNTFVLSYSKLPEKIFSDSTTHVAFLKALSKLHFLTLHTDVSRLYEKNVSLREIPKLSLQAIKEYEIDFVMTQSYPSFSFLKKEIIQFYFAEYLEKTFLARIEWIKAIGVMMGAVELAQDIFEKIKTSYYRLFNDFQKKKKDKKQSISILLGYSFQGQWIAPFQEGPLVSLFKSLGFIVYPYGLYEGNKAHGNFSTKNVLKALKDKKIDFWFVNNSLQSKKELLSLEKHLFFHNFVHQMENKMWDYGKKKKGIKNDYWETAMLRIDLLLQDFIWAIEGDGQERNTIWLAPLK